MRATQKVHGQPWTFLFPAAVALLTFLAFLPTLGNGFADRADPGFLLDNPHFRGFAWENLRWMFTTTWKGPYMPLGWLSFALDYKLWGGMDPFGFHLTSLVLHALAAALVCLLFRRLLPGGSWLAAACGALFFALHPLRVESVSWAIERRGLLCAVFVLGSFLCYLRGRLAASVALFWAALLSKAMAVTVPGVLLALDVLVLGRLPMDIRRWGSKEADPVLREKYWFVLPALVTAWINLAGHVGAGSPIEQSPFPGAGLLLGAHNLVFYLWKTVWPAGMSAIYEAPRPFLWLRLFPDILFVALVSWWAWRGREKRPGVLAAWLSFILLLLPVLGWLKFARHSAADRYTYLATLPLTLLAAVGLERLLAGGAAMRRGALAGACLVLGALAAASWRQQMVWKDPRTQWEHAVAVAPECAMCRLNLCSVYAREEEWGKAREQCREAIRTDPALPPAYLFFGQVLMKQGRLKDAMPVLEQAERLDPEAIEIQAVLSGIRGAGKP